MSSVGVALGHHVLQAVLLGATGEQGPALLGLLLGAEFEMLMWCMHAAPVTLKDSMGSSMGSFEMSMQECMYIYAKICLAIEDGAATKPKMWECV